MEVKIYMLFAVLTAILIIIGYIVGGFIGTIFALVFSFIINFASYWYSDKIVLSVYRAKPISEKDYPEIYESVRKLSRKAGIPQPKIYMVNIDVPNAFATGRSPNHSAVAITKGLLRVLDVDELEGVLSHEMSHIKHRDTLIQSIAAVIGAAIAWIGYIFWFSSDDRNMLSFMFVVIFAPLAASIVRMSISRSREFFADKEGGMLTNPLYLASALEKLSKYNGKMRGNPAFSHMFIVNPFSGKFSSLFSTHPPIEERIARLRKMAV